MFDLILIYAHEYIRYMIMSITDVRNISTVIYPFGDIVDKCCAKYVVNYNVICGMIY